MKRFGFFILLTLFVAFGLAEDSAQEKSIITVKKTDVTKGVVTLDILKAGKGAYLQCNEGMPACTALKVGKYQLVELPKNFGMYECRDVEVYPESAQDPEEDQKLGEYCMADK